jgi:cysteinyl-tRNA synthetase
MWMHGEFLVVKAGEKMAKSGENFLTVTSVLERGYDPLAYRYLCLGTHYRKQLSFGWEAMDGAQNSLRSLRARILDLRGKHGHGDGSVTADHERRFIDAVTDDLNLPLALAVLYDTLGDTRIGPTDKYALALRFDAVLGLRLAEVGEEETPDAVLRLVSEREAARAVRDWKRSDEIRDAILREGYAVQDTPSGPVVVRR